MIKLRNVGHPHGTLFAPTSMAFSEDDGTTGSMPGICTSRLSSQSTVSTSRVILWGPKCFRIWIARRRSAGRDFATAMAADVLIA